MKGSGQANEARAKIELQADQKNWNCPSNLTLTGKKKSPTGIERIAVKDGTPIRA